MRKRKFFYYAAGSLCLLVSALLLLKTNILPIDLNTIITYEKVDTGYTDYYAVNFNMPKNSLRQGTVYLPVYSIFEEPSPSDFLTAFDMEGANVIDKGQYFEATSNTQALKIYKDYDILEYSNRVQGPQDKIISNDEAAALAENFLNNHFPISKPYEIEITRKQDGITVFFVQTLAKLPNRAFTTSVSLDEYGSITEARLFYFEYEPLGYADMHTVRSALALLPREPRDLIYLKKYELFYSFEDSVLQPVYKFTGEHSDGTPFAENVPALKFH